MMSTRNYRLPGIHELSKDQENALARPSTGRHLIVGGPGTGKSILALLRAQRHQRNREDHVFLVHNHLLHRACIELSGNSLESKTWDTWFRELFSELSKQPIPTRTPENANDYRPINWDAVEKAIHGLPAHIDYKPPILVIDEGQDMPRGFYGSLVNLGFEHFFVVADQNQQITEDHSSRSDIANGLDIEQRNIIEMRINHRNSRQIARLAREFHTRDPSVPLPALPPQSNASIARPSIPTLFTYDTSRLERVAGRILRLCDRKPETLVGILAPNNAVRQRYLDALVTADVKLDHPRPSIETFHGGHRPQVSFRRGGILVINAQACKGLEFDTVILADIDDHIFWANDPDRTRRLFYVMVSRARERVILLRARSPDVAPTPQPGPAARNRPQTYPMDSILPSDPNVLQRREL